MEFKVDNLFGKIYFDEEAAGQDIGVSLLSFIKLDLDTDNREHPYFKHFKTTKKTLAGLQKKYSHAVWDCLDLDNPLFNSDKPVDHPKGGKIRPLPPAFRTKKGLPVLFRLEMSDFNTQEVIAPMQYQMLKGFGGEMSLGEVFNTDDVAVVCYVEFMKMIQYGLSVRVCQNCGKYFIPKGEYDTKYCDRVPEGENRTCKQIGAVKVFRDKIAKDPILTEYNKLYRRFHARKRNGIITPEQFTSWSQKAAELRERALKEKMPIDQFRKEIDSIGSD